MFAPQLEACGELRRVPNQWSEGSDTQGPRTFGGTPGLFRAKKYPTWLWDQGVYLTFVPPGNLPRNIWG